MVRWARTDTDVIFLRDRILFGENALFRLIVEFHGSTEILFGTHAHRVAFLERHIIENIHFKWSAQALIFLFDKNRQTITSSFG